MSIFSCPLFFMFLPLYILFPYLPRLLLLRGASFLPSCLIFFWQERRFDYPTVAPASRGQLPRWSCLYLAGSSSRERPRGRMHRRCREERLSVAGERVSMASPFVCLFVCFLCICVKMVHTASVLARSLLEAYLLLFMACRCLL